MKKIMRFLRFFPEMRRKKETSHAAEAAVLEALGKLTGPEGRALTDSGVLSAIVIHEKKAYFSLTLDPQSDFEPLRDAARDAARDAPGIEDAIVSLIAKEGSKTAKTASMSATPRSEDSFSGNNGGAKNSFGAVIAVASGKGGVGKSTLACYLAVEFQALGLRTGLLDADAHGPSAPHMLGLPSLMKDAAQPEMPLVCANGLKVASIGLVTAPDQALIWRGPIASATIRKLRDGLSWGALDVLIIDMPPGTGDIPLTLAQKAGLSGAVIVTTPQEIALSDVRRSLAMFRRIGTPIIGLVENMSGFACPACGETSLIFGKGGGARFAEESDIPFLGAIPLAPRIQEETEAGDVKASGEFFRDVALKIKAVIAQETSF